MNDIYALRFLTRNSFEKTTKENKQQTEPSSKTINNILNFSKAYKVEKTSSTGYLEMMLN